MPLVPARVPCCLRLLSTFPLLLSLVACIPQQEIVQQPPAGYYPDPARLLHQRLQVLQSEKRWQDSQHPINLPLVANTDEQLAAAYFNARYPFLGLDAPGIDLFAAPQASQAFFEPAPPFANAAYSSQIAALNAQTKPLKQALDDADLHFDQDYLGRVWQTNQSLTGIAHFFLPEERFQAPNQQKIYGVFAHYVAANAEPTKSSTSTQMQLQPLFYDTEKKAFYYKNANVIHWLYALAHPTERTPSIWEGDQKVEVTGVQATGGQCGRSVREWFTQQNGVELPDEGFNHLGSGQVEYSATGESLALTQSVAFDQSHAHNLLFEPKPPLPDEQLKEYRDRLKALGAKPKALLSSLDDLDILPNKPYMAASRGTDTFSHTGVVRFYSPTERSRDAENHAVYGEFIHNWNAKRRQGLMSISALYYDGESGLFYWKNGEGREKKMWIYGVAEPSPIPTLEAPNQQALNERSRK